MKKIYLTTFAILISSLGFVFGQKVGEKPAPQRSGLSPGAAIVLGLVEGITEYLPVSSTGHLLLAERLLGLGGEGQKESADAYAICIQAGAILAVLLLYFGRVKTMAAGLLGRNQNGLRLSLNILVAFLPAVIIGLLLGDHIKKYLFGVWPVVSAWAAGGVVILWVSGSRRRDSQAGGMLESLGWQQALIIGLIQCLAMWPGVSRSLVTILGGVLVGLSVPAAVEFSFLLGLVTLSAATAHDAYQSGHTILRDYGLFTPILGFICALVSALAAVKWMVNYLQRHGLAVFGWYRIGLAAVITILIVSGILRI